MAALIDDELLETFAVQAEPNDDPGRIAERFDGLLDRATLQLPSVGSVSRSSTVRPDVAGEEGYPYDQPTGRSR